MKRLLLLDTDVIIDLHTFGLFEKIAKAYDVKVTRDVFREAKSYPKGNKVLPINIKDKVNIIENVDIECLRLVTLEAREARLAIEAGESSSIAYLLQDDEDLVFCSCDKAAIKLLSYLDLDEKGMSLEKVLKNASLHKKLLPRHLEKQFKECIKEGKSLRIQFQLKLT